VRAWLKSLPKRRAWRPGDTAGLLGHLRAHGKGLPLGDVARLVAWSPGSPGSLTWRWPPRR